MSRHMFNCRKEWVEYDVLIRYKYAGSEDTSYLLYIMRQGTSVEVY